MEIFALVGPSGTGKSHRAIAVAYDYNIDAIIDDGLLINGSDVLAGKSAKRQSTKIGAIKTALFTDPEHAAEVRRAIDQLRPDKLLVLGTSEGMVQRITENLHLPQPQHYLNITEIASAEEINRALYTRRQYGKHIIPAPTVAVKPRLSGTLIEPVRTLLKRRHASPSQQEKKLWVEQSVVQPTFNYFGKFYIANNVLSQIISYATESVPQVAKANKAHVKNHEYGVEFTVDITVNYGHYLPGIAAQVQKAIIDTIEHMTALHVIAVNINVKKLVIKED